MFLMVKFDGKGKITKVIRLVSGDREKIASRSGCSIVSNCPKDTYLMSTDKIKDNMRVRDKNGIFVEIEHAKK